MKLIKRNSYFLKKYLYFVLGLSTINSYFIDCFNKVVNHYPLNILNIFKISNVYLKKGCFWKFCVFRGNSSNVNTENFHLTAKQISPKLSKILLLNENLNNDLTATIVSLKNRKILENNINVDLDSLNARVNAEARAIEVEHEKKKKQMKKLNNLAHLYMDFVIREKRTRC